jgi:hypothetical protein
MFVVFQQLLFQKEVATLRIASTYLLAMELVERRKYFFSATDGLDFVRTNGNDFGSCHHHHHHRRRQSSINISHFQYNSISFTCTDFARSLSGEHYDLQVVSPRNYFLFTPLLASTAVGTLESRTIIESIRHARKEVHVD